MTIDVDHIVPGTTVVLEPGMVVFHKTSGVVGIAKKLMPGTTIAWVPCNLMEEQIESIDNFIIPRVCDNKLQNDALSDDNSSGRLKERVQELIEANNRLLERARKAEARANALDAQIIHTMSAIDTLVAALRRETNKG